MAEVDQVDPLVQIGITEVGAQYVLKQYPHLLGVGLSEGSAILVTRDLAEVLGNRVAVYDATDPLSLIPLRWLDPGDVYDVGARRIFLEERGRDEDR